MRYYGLDAIAAKKKDAMQKRIDARLAVYARRASADFGLLHERCGRAGTSAAAYSVGNRIDLGVALYHGEFAAVSALMEANGVPIDQDIFPQLADQTIWRGVRDAMVPAIDAKYGVYVRNAAGDWTFNMERFAAYLTREGILAGRCWRPAS